MSSPDTSFPLRRAAGALVGMSALVALLAVALALAASGCASSGGGGSAAIPEDARVPPGIASPSFENRSGFAASPWKLGPGMADVLLTTLSGTRAFTVIERSRLENPVAPDVDRQSGVQFRPEGELDLGPLKHCAYFVRGVINDFDQPDASGFGFAVVHALTLGHGYKARVALTLTVIDVATGDVLETIPCAGSARARRAFSAGDYRDVPFGGEAYFRSPLGKATLRAVRRGVERIRTQAPRARERITISEVPAPNRIILNRGSVRGINANAVYEVRGGGRPVKDPATGGIISVIPGPIVGRLRLVEVNEFASYAVPIEGAGFVRGQVASPVGNLGTPIR